jgi:hypothetical protein
MVGWNDLVEIKPIQVCANETRPQPRSTSATQLKRRERRGAAHRDRAEPQTARQAPWPCSTLCSRLLSIGVPSGAASRRSGNCVRSCGLSTARARTPMYCTQEPRNLKGLDKEADDKTKFAIHSLFPHPARAGGRLPPPHSRRYVAPRRASSAHRPAWRAGSCWWYSE